MNKLVSIALIAVLGVGCKKKKPEEGLEPPPAPPPAGSAMTPPPAAPKPVSPEDLAKRLDECWGLWNAGKYDDFKGCFAPDATSEMPGSGMPVATGAAAVVEATKMLKPAFPDLKSELQLQLIDGNHAATVVLFTGTQTGPMDSPMGTIAPTNKKIGVMMAQALDFDDAGHAKHEGDYFDLATMLGQLSPMKDHPVRSAIDKLPMPRETVIAKDDEAEKANLAAAKSALDAFNKHDAKAFGDALATPSTWSEQAEAKDWDRTEAIAQAAAVWKGFSDLKMNASSTWAAGTYVVTVATMEGTNDAPIPALGIKVKTGKKVTVPFLAIQQLDKGKITHTWIFDQGLAFATQLGLIPPPAAK